jgi:hypothetical protein
MITVEMVMQTAAAKVSEIVNLFGLTTKDILEGVIILLTPLRIALNKPILCRSSAKVSILKKV